MCTSRSRFFLRSCPCLTNRCLLFPYSHEWTTTVREAFRYSAYLRQPYHVSKQEKDDYCEEILQLLCVALPPPLPLSDRETDLPFSRSELEDLADALIGFPGFGLSVEARKRLTIGVELAAKPQLLLFLDEPTSGLDGQSAFNIVRFLRKLAAAGQSILCTSQSFFRAPLDRVFALLKPLLHNAFDSPSAQRYALRELRPTASVAARRTVCLLRRRRKGALCLCC